MKQPFSFFLPAFFFLFALATIAATAQPRETWNYAAADAFARGYAKKISSPPDLGVLAADTKAKFAGEYERARVAYTWIAENIAFDVDADPKGPSVDALKILQTRKATAAGYASLYQTLCKFLMDIDTEIVTGYSKVMGDFANNKKPLKPNHAWNIVKIEEKQYLVDVCWGAGFLDDAGNVFTKKFDPFYFATEPAHFIYDHYPENPGYQLMVQKISSQTFFIRPLVRHEYFQLGITDFEPVQGVLVRKKGGFVALGFTVPTHPVRTVTIRTDSEQENTMGELESNGDKYYYTYKTRRAGSYTINVWVDNKWVMTYKILPD